MSDRNPPDILHVQQDDPEYMRMVREEAEFWDSRSETLLTGTPMPVVQQYLNERLTGHPDRRWYETIGDERTVAHGCVFGAGPGHVEESLLERNPELSLTAFDISGEALARLQGRIDAKYPGRLNTQQQDLNFVELPANTYDLAVANSSMHHLVNLEHVAFQVNRSLAQDGRFFIDDTVSESFMQFSEEKKRIFELLNQATQDSLDTPIEVAWPERENWSFSPFESVRSGEILEIFERYLQPVKVATVGALLDLTIFVRKYPKAKRLGRWIGGVASRRTGTDHIAHGVAKGELLFLLDGLMCDTARLLPGRAFVEYAKRQA